MKQYVLTPAAGKRLIAKALIAHPVVSTVAKKGTIVVLAGTTNRYVAQELLTAAGKGGEFTGRRFFRGITLPPSQPVTGAGRVPDESEFPGDVILKDGVLQKGKTIFDVVDDLKEGDLVIKGANALDLQHRRAAILIGHPSAGTIGVTLQALTGRRVRLILPVGLEKCVPGDFDAIANRINAPGVKGPRFWPVPGEVFTELDAVELLTGAAAELIASGGVCGAEGSVRIFVSGTDEQMEKAESLIKSIASEPLFEA